MLHHVRYSITIHWLHTKADHPKATIDHNSYATLKLQQHTSRVLDELLDLNKELYRLSAI